MLQLGNRINPQIATFQIQMIDAALLVDSVKMLTGPTGVVSELDQVINNISSRTSGAFEEIWKLPEKDEKQISLFGPYLGRTFLETAFMILIARLDGFRILSLMHLQSNEEYDVSKKSSIAIQWQGDIFANQDPDYKLMWSQDVSTNKVNRALLGNYFEVVYWRKAYQFLQDEYNASGRVKILSKYTASTSATKFIPRLRGEISGYYSCLSKGVHGELVVKTDIVYDRTTVISTLKDMMEAVFAISLVSHCVHSAHTKIEIEHAIDISNQVKEAIDKYGQE